MFGNHLTSQLGNQQLEEDLRLRRQITGQKNEHVLEHLPKSWNSLLVLELDKIWHLLKIKWDQHY